jgi:pimeloyl-ACP methyl ester carboxylesterase
MAYTKEFGGEVAGLVMVDASHPEQFKRGMLVAQVKRQSSAMTIMKLGAALSWTGLPRLMAGQGKPMPNQSLEAARAQGAYLSTSIKGAIKEMIALPAILEEAGTFLTLGDRPLVVLTAMKLPTPAQLAQGGMSEAQAKEQKEEWRKFHDDEASWSSHSIHRLVPDASHYIQFDRPDIVIEAVRTVVAAVRGAQHGS